MSSPPKNRVIDIEVPLATDWPKALTETIVELTLRLQAALADSPTAPVLLSVVCPEGPDWAGASIDANVEACRGFAQSVALEIPSSRCSVMITNAEQSQDRAATSTLFLGANGGFIAGATYDLRTAR